MSGAITLRPVTAGKPTTAPIQVISMRLLTPWTGVWMADLEIDADPANLPPVSGKVAITLGSPVPIVTLTGTIDPRGSGTFGPRSILRVLGGGAGWDHVVPPQDYQSDGGIPNTRVYSETAQLVGETVNVLSPVFLGKQVVRSMGPASRVLDGLEWWVDLAGVTQIGARTTAKPDPSLTLISWDPSIQAAEITCDVLVLPGTVIVDPRLPGPVTVRDVDQRFDAAGSHVTAWCGASATAQLMGDMRAMVVEFSGRKFLATYSYRIVSQDTDGRLHLQSVAPSAGVPDTLPIEPWTGLSGASARYRPGSIVRLAFVDGDPTQPLVDSYQPGVVPLEATVDASVKVHVGPSAVAVELAGGPTPLVVAPWAAGVQASLVALAAALANLTAAPLTPLSVIGGALTTALGALPSPATLRVTGQ